MADSELLTTEEVSQRYRVKEGTLRYWRSIGEGPAYFSLGRRIVYRLSECERWVAEQEEAAITRRAAAV
ncbi:helix-turn-helix domain-containing protein [Mycobacteroides abscessus subsp. abscessus]|uniref:helix-turn-helix transcriptional regulator n=1 Tax=Mycobacteroides TaxID=670516 RepID=UPI00092B8066|nr:MULTISPECIES: helix-turn-helix domain-containing protein [Mycobacteroides]MDO3099861.1 helix-turn-helix domain-containing protein [Mycobacteroides abscessus subsp. abscessus]MDO3187467.1 helix-turn-helix domain-containing protein [Mycobacteroides abscessus subsp. abscessus]MDO3192489.1 helix-turn-helix domain-containing protein [Mycobacteroides abscessus subsp. abscessus]MDO3369979.1 helix-turn-helix domain-containing protein [Mycobacteroides abscessus subsp. abscessus]QSM70578.1 helix-turn